MPELFKPKARVFLPVQKPAILHHHFWQPDEGCPPPLFGANWNAIGADILITPIHSSHVSVVQLDQLWLLDIDSIPGGSTPATYSYSWLSPSRIGCYIYRAIVIPADYSNCIFFVVFWSKWPRSFFSCTFGDSTGHFPSLLLLITPLFLECYAQADDAADETTWWIHDTKFELEVPQAGPVQPIRPNPMTLLNFL